ncbi:MAG TPA: kelch repeat-containing protein [Chitinophagales bacterium]|nr:kelch repeat-containing protein [Chitinophagales bacterium]
MKKITILIAILTAAGLNSSRAQNTWTQKTNFGGTTREAAVGFSIGSKGYIGTGYNGSYKNDFWEYDPATNAWTQKANFGGTARYRAVGFSIGSKGYIGSGYDNNYKNDFWEYDPVGNSWTQKTNFGGVARYDASGFSIGDKGYIGAGYDGSNKNDFWEYDPSSNTWTQKTNFGGTARRRAVGFSIGTKGYIGTGLDNSNKNDFWEYNPVTNAWTQKANFGGSARYFATGFSIDSNGYIGTGYSNLNDFWEYDPVTNAWAQKANFGGSGRYWATGFSIGSRGYIGTGYDGNYKNDFWEYTPPCIGQTFYEDADNDGYGNADDTLFVANCIAPTGYVANKADCDDANASLNPGATEVINCMDENCNGIIDEGAWIQKTNFGGIARYNAVGFSIGAKAYIGTGKTSTNTYKKDFWEYDPAINVWSQKADFGGAARYKASGFAIGTKGYIGTGYNSSGSLVKDFWEYDIATNAWTKKANFGGTGRQSAASFSIGTKGYIGTGGDFLAQHNDFWEYDPATNHWTQKANVGDTLREAAVGFSIGSKGYIGTGSNSSGYKNDFWEYDPAANTWTQKAAFAGSARQAATGFSIDTKGYLGTGYDGSYKNDFYEYDPTNNAWKQNAHFTGVVRAYAVGLSVSGKGYIGTGGGTAGSAYNDFMEYDVPVFVGLKVYADADGDGFGDPGNSILTADCGVPGGYVLDSSDCDDANSAINPNGLPTKQWDVRFGGTLDDRLSEALQTTDGGYALGGRSKSGISGDKTQANWDGTNATWDYWLVKTDAAGEKQWDKRYGGTKNDELVTLNQTIDGGYILGGHGYSGLNGDKSQSNYDAAETTADYWIVKTDASGNKQWDFRYGGSGDDQYQDLELTSDGGYLLGGYSTSGISGDKSQASQGNADYWIIKINSAGVKQWDARYGGTDADYLYDLEQTADGGYILGGRSYSGIGGDKTQANRDGSNTTFDYWIVKIDANGIKQWDKRFGGTGDDVFYALKQASGGGYILAGYSGSGIGGDKTQATQGGTDYWMVKIDANGAKLWDARFGGSSDEQLYVLERSSDDGYLLSGYSNSGISGDKTQSNQGVRDFWIVKTDNSGVKKWDIRFGGTKADVATSLQHTADGGYIAGGFSFSGATGDRSQANWDGSLLTQDYWIVKLTSGTGQLPFYIDADGDGYGTSTNSVLACNAPAGYVSNNTDCNDDPALGGAIHPGTPDICNSIDDNCNGDIDENAITATITPTGSVSTCSGVAITLTANTGSGISYQWLKNSANISGATNSTYSTSKGASYQVSEIDNFSCVSTSAVTTLSVIAKPAATITPLGNLDICATGSVVLQANSGAGLTYQWLKGGNNVSGATNQTYTATKQATYKVIVTNSSGCSKTSAGVKVTKSCKESSPSGDLSNTEMNIYPNPTDGTFTLDLKFNSEENEEALIQVLNMTGQVVYDKTTIVMNGVLQNEIQFNEGAADGTYLVKVTVSDHIYSAQINYQK